MNKQTFDIRYVKVHFTVEFIDDSNVPIYKASALRGGMGEMLLRANCIKDRDCENCDFETECIVRRTMYSKMEIQPTFMTSGDSVGYVIECEDYNDHFAAGDKMQFNLILFGKTIVYFSQYLNAFYALGVHGLGKEYCRFRIVSVTNTLGVPILNGNDVNMKNYKVMSVADYILFRKCTFQKQQEEITIKFQSPLTVKFRGKELREFRSDALIEAACRRLYMLDCFEGIESIVHDKTYVESIKVPKVICEEHIYRRERRYSERQKSAMFLSGIEGHMVLRDISEDLLDILMACELVHLGKNTSFGFGRFRIC